MGERKHYLDWLRIVVFGLLILYHAGMLYVSWPYNLKSPRIIPALEWPMNALSPWRMGLLFVISGVVSRFMMARLGPGRFALERVRRLLPPILTGMFLIIPPQTYVELVAKTGLDMPYLAFWLGPYLHADQTLVRPLHKTMPTWDHLWFVVYLLNYAIVFAVGAAAFGRRRVGDDEARAQAPLWPWLILPALWMVGLNVAMATISPFTHAFIGDWAADLKGFGLYLIGVGLAGRASFWSWIRARWIGLAGVALGLLAVQMAAMAIVPLEGDGQPLWQVLVRAIPDGLYGWSGVLAALGLGARFLDRPSALLRWLNRAVLPVYVLHQPILLVAAFLIFPLRLPLAVEAPSLVIITGGGTLLLYAALIRPFPLMRFLFGDRLRAPVEGDPHQGIARPV
jgi:hypothetical protein